MHLYTILAFAILFWRAEQPAGMNLLGDGDTLVTLAVATLQPLLLGGLAALTAGRAGRLLLEQPDQPQIAQFSHHRSMLMLRSATLILFAGTVFCTRWYDWFSFSAAHPALQIVGDLIVLAPFVASVLAVWLAVYPLERTLRAQSLRWPTDGQDASDGHWSLRSYLDFNLRHQLLIAAVPMVLILFAANLTRGYRRELQTLTGWVWAADALLGAVALAVFVLAPLLLSRIWRTVPLTPGPVRDRLERLCRRIGLRCRNILVWHSDGMMINAAVMGVLPQVRYVLLSDALLETMSARQIEAVFGHEAGHVRHRHIQHFLIFALVGWLLIGGMMELLAGLSIRPDSPLRLSIFTIQTIGALATVAFWGLGFGWLSRRFEREADLFGARCVTPGNGDCTAPCNVHVEDREELTGPGRVCATGASVFASALDRVAVLNGIPHEERSWRHSSIGSRIRFLTSLSGDPRRAASFERMLRRVKVALVVTAAVGTVVSVYYMATMSEPAILRLEAGAPPAQTLGRAGPSTIGSEDLGKRGIRSDDH